MRDRRALAGMNVFSAYDDIEFAVLLENVALANTAGDDRNHAMPLDCCGKPAAS
jgi:hypothetical protein